MSVSNKIVIIGAGPYGLSIAAHLRARGIGFRIFGKPMANWQRKMPRGMQLKSDGFASNLSDPEDRFSLEAFCAEQG
ncbi:MAG TPA: NAD(P)/FAD-dependent oxidoreductase, partial [Stellaceae bacterium]|nr:NAD(P)/FAD-dependent oxidoreductase [Stellaceae bacterium]